MYWKHWTTGTYFSVLLGGFVAVARSRFANEAINSSRTRFRNLSTFSMPSFPSGDENARSKTTSFLNSAVDNPARAESETYGRARADPF